MRSTLLRTILSTLLLRRSPGSAWPRTPGEHSPEDVEKAFPKKPPYSPYAGRNYPTRPFFGDTHLHTAFSMDAGAVRRAAQPAPTRSGSRAARRSRRTPGSP